MSRILFFSLFIGSVAGARTEVSFAPVTEVSDRSVLTWADLAVVKSGTDELLRELAQIPWTREADPRAVLRERRLMSDVYSRLNVKFVLPAKMEVKRVSGYNSAEFRRKLLNQLSVICGECRFEIRHLQDARVRLPSDWSMDESAVKAAGSLLVPVSSASRETTWIAVQLKIQRPGLVLKRSALIGQKIGADDVESRDVDATFARETPVRLEDLSQAAVARTLNAGQTLYPSDLRKEEAVKRGQIVKLMMGTDDFEVSVSATAEENGRAGDFVKVKNTESGKVLSGLVTGVGQVRLQ
ncbi:MAG: flagellar basal body P-ring formation protein FlgA [Bdellovibrionaceae bacterium]|nr:flagellar basal body P-ring formation protein FlgA [Pseudobdellovibrionaceae bacterium]